MSNKYALVIGNSLYKDRGFTFLKTPDSDVNKLSTVLESPKIGGFKITKLINETADTIRREIARFFSSKKRDDLLIFYFSGHGVLNSNGELYLAAKDTEPTLISGTAIPTSFIAQEINNSRSHRQLILLDCCHSGAFGRTKNVIGSSVGIKNYFLKHEHGYSRTIITASDATQFAWEGNKEMGNAKNSIFTHCLIQGIESGEADLNQDGWVDDSELYEYVHDMMLTLTTQQKPMRWSFNQNGRLLLTNSGRYTPDLSNLPSELQEAIASPLALIREGAVKELGQILQTSNQELTRVAHFLLTKLLKDDSKTVSTAALDVLNLIPKANETSSRINIENKDTFNHTEEEFLTKLENILSEGNFNQIEELILLFNPTNDMKLNIGRYLAQVVENRDYPLTARLCAGQALNLVGDCRFWDENLFFLPKDEYLGFIEIVEGTFSMRNNESDYLDCFYIAKYPVTTAQYSLFSRSDYNETYANYPAGNISWHAAIEYCNWLQNQFAYVLPLIPSKLKSLLENGWIITIPSKEMWEKAACGTKGFLYPWGNDYQLNYSNHKMTNLNSVCPVGCFPNGVSSYGVHDMSGNIWEWTKSLHLQPNCFPTSLQQKTNTYIIKGGSFDDEAEWLQCSANDWTDANFSDNTYGFRICLVKH